MMEGKSSILAICKYKNRFLLLLVLVIMILTGAHANNGWEILPKESLKPPKQFKHDKTHIIKTFKEDNGDIIDCVDIYKQPALSHPLLKTHKVQLKPDGIPSNNLTKSRPFLHMIECPEGYVPIRRTSKEDLIMTQRLNYSMNMKLATPQNPKRYEAMLVYRSGRNQGAKGYVNVWNLPNFPPDQWSAASILILDGTQNEVDGVMAGWMVYPNLFKDNRPRLFTYWNVHGSANSGCFNTLCPGFVQVSNQVLPSAPIQPVSVYEGVQYSVEIHIFQDQRTGHWWLIFQGISVGYWPKKLFNLMQTGANYAGWGGQVTNPSNAPSAPMGNGKDPNKVFIKRVKLNKVAYIKQIKVSDGKSYFNPNGATTVSNGCYGVEYYGSEFDNWEDHIYYGGPGGCT